MARFYDDGDHAKAVKDLFGPRCNSSGKSASSRPRISCELFRRIVEERNQGPSAACTVLGLAEFSGTHFKRGLEFREVRFESSFVADVATFASLTFLDCEFSESLMLRNCRIKGSLLLAGCRFAPAEDASEDERIFLRGSRIEGDLLLNGAAVAGTCSLAGIVVGGNLKAGGLRADPPAESAALLLDNVRVSGGIALTPFAVPAPDGAGRLYDSRLEIVSAYGATCHSFSMIAAEIVGLCDLSGLQVATSVELTDSVFGGDLRLNHVDCGEVLTVNHCSVAGVLSFDGSTVPVQLRIADGVFGDINFNSAKIGSFWVGSGGEVSCTRIYGTNSAFSSYVKMSRLTVRISKDGGPCASAATEAPRDESGMIEFENCRFGALVTTWPVIGVAEIDGWGKNHFVKVERGFSFTDCDVGGHLSLTRLEVGGSRAAEAGFVRLDRTRLRGPLFVSSPLAIARRRQVPERTRRKAREIVKAGADAGYRARMRSLSMREFVASAVELSGLDLVTCKLSDDDSGDDGSLLGDRMEIAGRFETYVGEAKPGLACDRLRAHANIGGALRLRAAKIGELHLAGDSFRQRHNCVASLSGVILELAEIGVLRVPRIEGPNEPDLNGFPVPLDLSGMTVRHWNFHEDVDAETRVTADDFLAFLDNDETLHREVYKSVAGSLRDSGRDDEAEQVLYAEEYRARWESRRPEGVAGSEWPVMNRPFSIFGIGPKPRLKGRRPRPLVRLGRLFEPFDRYFLHYRRNTINLLYLILGLWAVSVLFVSSQADNFELSDHSRLILQQERVHPTGLAAGIHSSVTRLNAGPDPRKWGLWSRIWMATRYHVPIVSIMAEDEYVASNDNRLQVGVPFAGRFQVHGLTAEDWFAVMTILNWIMWPLLLTFALRRALRSD